MGKWADEGDGLNVDSVGLVQFLTRCWPLTFSGHSQRRRLAANSSFSSFPALFSLYPPIPLRIRIRIHIDVARRHSSAF